jgi:ribosomal protein S18 acetylase RimI-like enzyme
VSNVALSIIIRPLESGGEIAYAARVHASLRYLFDPHLNASTQPTSIEVDSELKMMERLWGKPEQLLIGAFIVGESHPPEPIGFHWATYNADATPRVAKIISLWVSPEKRNQGIATRLKLAGEVWAQSQNCSAIETSVHQSNRAMLEINHRQGFEPYRLILRKKL